MWDFTYKLSLSEHPDSLQKAACEWFGVGLHAGFRSGEWAQKTRRTINQPFDIDDFGFGLCRAFLLGDIKFMTNSRRAIPLNEAITMQPSLFQKVQLTFRIQKNLNHGETRIFTTSSSRINCVLFWLNIVKRFFRLCGERYDIPLAVFKDAQGTVRYMSAADLTPLIRLAASKVYGLDLQKHKDELQRWSMHSLRVGGCVILFGMGFSPLQIQFLLRWKSWCFVDYLRNLQFMVKKQTQAINDALDKYPHFV